MTPIPFRNAVTYPAIFFGFTIGLVSWLASVGFGLIAYRYWLGDDGYYTTEGLMQSLNLLIIYTFIAFSGSIIWLNDAWNRERAAWLERQQAERQRKPQPARFQSVNERARALTLRREDDNRLPLSDRHYMLIYRKLQRNRPKWKVTRQALTVKDAGVPAFRALTHNYGNIVKHWEWLGWVKDGKLTDKGRREFIANAGVHLLGETSPTDD